MRRKKEETKAAETTAETAEETKVDETKAAETTAGEAADKVIMVVSFGTSYKTQRSYDWQPLKQQSPMLIRNMRYAGLSQARLLLIS